MKIKLDYVIKVGMKYLQFGVIFQSKEIYFNPSLILHGYYLPFLDDTYLLPFQDPKSLNIVRPCYYKYGWIKKKEIKDKAETSYLR